MRVLMLFVGAFLPGVLWGQTVLGSFDCFPDNNHDLGIPQVINLSATSRIVRVVEREPVPGFASKLVRYDNGIVTWVQQASRAIDVKLAPSGRLVSLGKELVSNDWNGQIQETSLDGEILSSRLFLPAGSRGFSPGQVFPLPDGSSIITGITHFQSTGSHATIMRLDPLGAQVWIQLLTTGTSVDLPIGKRSLIGGTLVSCFASGTGRIWRVSDSGAVEMSVSFAADGEYDRTISYVEDASGSVISCHRDNEAGRVRKFSPTGAPVWSRTISPLSFSHITDLELEPTGGLVAYCNNGWDPTILRFDSTGQLIATRSFGAGGSPSNLIRDSSGFFYFCTSDKYVSGNWLPGSGFRILPDLSFYQEFPLRAASNFLIDYTGDPTFTPVRMHVDYDGEPLVSYQNTLDMDGYLARVQPDGQLQPAGRFRGAFLPSAMYYERASNGDFFFAVNMQQRNGTDWHYTSRIRRVSPSGETVWQYDAGSLAGSPVTFLEDSSSNVYVGTIFRGFSTYELTFHKLDVNGIEVWPGGAKLHIPLSDSPLLVSGLHPYAGGYVFTYAVSSFDAPRRGVFLGHVDQNGSITSRRISDQQYVLISKPIVVRDDVWMVTHYYSNGPSHLVRVGKRSFDLSSWPLPLPLQRVSLDKDRAGNIYFVGKQQATGADVLGKADRRGQFRKWAVMPGNYTNSTGRDNSTGFALTGYGWYALINYGTMQPNWVKSPGPPTYFVPTGSGEYLSTKIQGALGYVVLADTSGNVLGQAELPSPFFSIGIGAAINGASAREALVHQNVGGPEGQFVRFVRVGY